MLSLRVIDQLIWRQVSRAGPGASLEQVNINIGFNILITVSHNPDTPFAGQIMDLAARNIVYPIISTPKLVSTFWYYCGLCCLYPAAGLLPCTILVPYNMPY